MVIVDVETSLPVGFDLVFEDEGEVFCDKVDVEDNSIDFVDEDFRVAVDTVEEISLLEIVEVGELCQLLCREYLSFCRDRGNHKFDIVFNENSDQIILDAFGDACG
jgi:hypothetical protein